MKLDDLGLTDEQLEAIRSRMSGSCACATCKVPCFGIVFRGREEKDSDRDQPACSVVELREAKG